MKKNQTQVIELGDEVKDKISGYVGIVQGVMTCLTGCDRADVRASGLDKDGALKSGYFFDVYQLEILKKKKVDPASVRAPEEKEADKPARRLGGPPTRSF